MDSITCVFIGAGAAGHQVLGAFQAVPGFRCVLLVDRAGRGPSRFPGLDCRTSLPDTLPPCNLLVLAVQDREIAPLASELACLDTAHPPGIAAHLSAATPLDALGPLVTRAWTAALIHPLQSLPREAPGPIAIPWWGLCAPAPAASRLGRLLEATGGKVRLLAPEDLLPWHLSATWVANLLPALLESALELWPGEQRRQMHEVLLPIMEQSLALQRQGGGGEPVVAGPLRRGDTTTLRRHLAWLGEHGSPGAVLSYSLLSATLLRRLEELGERPLDGDPELRNRLLAPPGVDHT